MTTTDKKSQKVFRSVCGKPWLKRRNRQSLHERRNISTPAGLFPEVQKVMRKRPPGHRIPVSRLITSLLYDWLDKQNSCKTHGVHRQ